MEKQVAHGATLVLCLDLRVRKRGITHSPTGKGLLTAVDYSNNTKLTSLGRGDIANNVRSALEG